MTDIRNAEDFAKAFNVSRETIARLEIYLALLQKWNPKINLVSKSTIENAWQRHFADSAQIWGLAPDHIQNWVDIGSGAGFPGLVIAAIAVEKNPDLHMTLIESDRRKSIFMQTVAREMGVDVTILTDRIEKIPAQSADVLSARALASLSQLLEFTEKHRKPQGVSLFPKGVNVDKELTDAVTSWHISAETFPSITDTDAVILRIGEFHRVK